MFLNFPALNYFCAPHPAPTFFLVIKFRFFSGEPLVQEVEIDQTLSGFQDWGCITPAQSEHCMLWPCDWFRNSHVIQAGPMRALAGTSAGLIHPLSSGIAKLIELNLEQADRYLCHYLRRTLPETEAMNPRGCLLNKRDSD